MHLSCLLLLIDHCIRNQFHYYMNILPLLGIQKTEDLRLDAMNMGYM